MTTPDDVRAECALIRVRATARAVTRHFEAALRPTGLKGPQFSLLVALAATAGATASDLEAHLGTERSTLVRNLKVLEADGLVATAPDGRARRKVLTAKGRAALERALPLWRGAQDGLVATLGPNAWAETRRRLKALRESVSA